MSMRRTCLVAVLAFSGAAPVLAADCTPFLEPGAGAPGKPGIRTCAMKEPRPIASASGVAYDIVEIGVSGSIEGYTTREAPRYEMLTDLPEYALAQRQNLGPYYKAVGQYTAERGALLTLFLPRSAANWNGKMFVLAHGMVSYGKVRELQPRKAGRYSPLMNVNEFAGLMIDRGYAVLHTSRPAARRENKASETVTLKDGTTMGEKSFGYHAGLIKDWTFFARRIVKQRLGREPERTYFYGKSAGGSLGRLMNYVPGVNRDAAGKRVFDGFLIDDAGGGWYMPTLNFRRVNVTDSSFSVERDDHDHLAFDETRLRELAHQIDFVHQGYSGADFVEGTYLSLKRLNTLLLTRKGASDKARTYEVVGLSHGDAGNIWPEPGWEQNLDQSGMMAAMIDLLDGWVDGRVVPPPTRSDDYRAADLDGDYRLDHPAVQLPEVACPLGVYYEFPPGVKAPGRTGFAAFLDRPRPAVNADGEALPPGFDEAWLEPLDSRGRPLDMNRNTVRDTRESVEEAWKRRRVEGQRYGTLDVDESFTPARYARCVIDVASELNRAGLLSEEALFHYVEEALTFRGTAPAADAARTGEAPRP